MNCPECERLNRELNHVIRNAGRQAPNFTEEFRNSRMIALWDKSTKYKIERNEARREVGELRARVALLEQIIAGEAA